MSLRDRFRSHRGSDDADEQVAGADEAGPADPIDFRPRFDGGYLDGTGIVLRFAPSTVQEVAGTSDGIGDGAASGEYTASGRFVVQRRFSRPIVYTVLSVSDDGFTVRRTDTNPGGAATESVFKFEPTGDTAVQESVSS